jgi:hypothetical protein
MAASEAGSYYFGFSCMDSITCETRRARWHRTARDIVKEETGEERVVVHQLIEIPAWA